MNTVNNNSVNHAAAPQIVFYEVARTSYHIIVAGDWVQTVNCVCFIPSAVPDLRPRSGYPIAPITLCVSHENELAHIHLPSLPGGNSPAPCGRCGLVTREPSGLCVFCQKECL